MRRFTTVVTVSLAVAGIGQTQNPVALTLADAQKIALQNNPQVASSIYSAQAAAQVPPELASVYQPTLFGSITGVGADSGTRIAAGALNNPIVFNRAATGLWINQYITDFGRTPNLVQSAKLRAQAQNQVLQTSRAQVLLQTN